MDILYEDKIKHTKNRMQIKNKQIIRDFGGVEFEITKKLMNGVNSTVFTGFRICNGRPDDEECVIKFLKQLDDSHIDRFKNEIRIHSNISHDNIIKYYGNGILIDPLNGREIPWIATELGGKNLYNHVLDGKNGLPNTYYAEKDFKRVSRQIINGVKYLHSKSILHRDIKPANFVTGTSSKLIINMIDFGICKYFNEASDVRPLDNFTRINERIGPAYFSSPELIEYGHNKKTQLTVKSDIFQIGMVLWFIATGKVNTGIPSKKEDPFKGKLYEAFIHTLHNDPSDRPTIDELLSRIDNI